MNVENFLTLFVMLLIVVVAFLGIKWLEKKLQRDFNQNGEVPMPNGKGKNLSLTRVNGCGMSFAGTFREANIDNYNTFVTYYTLYLLFIPLIPFKAYRVARSENGGFYILGSESMAIKEICVNFLRLFAWGMVIATIIFVIANML